MSINRIRKLAGLKESITNDPEINAEIERRLASPPSELGFQPPAHVWLDLLEIIQDGGRDGVSLNQIMDKMRKMNADDPGTLGIIDYAINSMLKYLPKMFDNVVRVDNKGIFRWKTDEDRTYDETDPEIRNALASQVELTSITQDIMRRLTAEHGSFSEAELAENLKTRIGPMATFYANHIIGQFRSMLLTVSPGRYAMMNEAPRTRDDSMDLFRDLEASARRNPPKDS